MTLHPHASADDIVGSWKTPEAQGVELGYHFYPDGVLVLQDSRHRRFTMQGRWALDENGGLMITDVIDPNVDLSDAERDLIREERHRIAITQISRDSMVWQPEEAREQVSFRRDGSLPGRGEKVFWKRLLGI